MPILSTERRIDNAFTRFFRATISQKTSVAAQKKEIKKGKLARCLKKENKKWYVGTKAQSLDELSNLATHLHHISSFFQFNSQGFFPINSYSILILSNMYGIEHLNVCAIEHLIFKIATILEILQTQYH